MEVSGQIHALAALTPREGTADIHWTGWVGPRTNLNAVPLPEIELSVQPVSLERVLVQPYLCIFIDLFVCIFIILLNINLYLLVRCCWFRSHAVAYLRHYSTIRKVAVSILNEDIGLSSVAILPAALCSWGWLSLQEKWVPGMFLGVKGGRRVIWPHHRHLRADCLENMAASMTHNPIGLLGLLHG
jgi:hypothetical protein